MIPTNKKYNHIWKLFEEIPDPEIPVLSILDLGIVREIASEDDTIVITITPTYSGCPAMNLFEDDIIAKLKENNIENVRVKMTYDPPWTTDWINDKARKRLEDYGIAPPIKGSQDKGELFKEGVKNVRCPQCKSKNTKVISQFGSTACKALYKCEDCLEPFDYFKCI
ncbi:MAG: phenylacetate-CoA oxygenase subunit PaaJ [Flavobacteriaceae bacterium]|nr:phenylacetate-CoA oxygenase subunit PaaJ [Flavobacteriaceae bacterium]